MKHSLENETKKEWAKLYDVWEQRLLDVIKEMKYEKNDYRLAGFYHDLNRTKTQMLHYIQYAQKLNQFEWDDWIYRDPMNYQENYHYGYGI
jgi:hypothetical protein